MSQDPRSWNPQGGYPQQGQPGQPPAPGQPPVPGQPPQPGGYGPTPQGGYPQPGHPQPGYPQPGFPQPGYPQPGHPQPGGYPQQPGYTPQAVYRPPGAGGYGPQGPAGGGLAPQGPKKKSPLMLILIVVAAVVLLAAAGGIIMALTRDGGDQPVTSITPSPPTIPTEDPSPSPGPTDPSSSPTPSDDPTPGQSNPPSGDSVDIGNGVQLTPASGWSVKKTTTSAAQLSDGKSLFLGQTAEVSPSTNPGQLCTAWHKQVAEGASGGKYQEPKDVDLGTDKLTGATCLAQVTVSTGQGSGTILLFSLVAVRPSDGVTTVGTLYFAKSDDSEQLDKDFATMVNSMLKSQASG